MNRVEGERFLRRLVDHDDLSVCCFVDREYFTEAVEAVCRQPIVNQPESGIEPAVSVHRVMELAFEALRDIDDGGEALDTFGKLLSVEVYPGTRAALEEKP